MLVEDLDKEWKLCVASMAPAVSFGVCTAGARSSHGLVLANLSQAAFKQLRTGRSRIATRI